MVARERKESQVESLHRPANPCFKRGFPQPRLFGVFFPGFFGCLRMPETGEPAYLWRPVTSAIVFALNGILRMPQKGTFNENPSINLCT